MFRGPAPFPGTCLLLCAACEACSGLMFWTGQEEGAAAAGDAGGDADEDRGAAQGGEQAAAHRGREHKEIDADEFW